MNREILFRGKTTKNNSWVYGDLIKNKDKYYIHPQANCFQVNNELGKLLVVHEVIPETIEQYIGFKDKKGNKVFDEPLVLRGNSKQEIKIKRC